MKTNIITTQRELNRATFEHYRPMLRTVINYIVLALMSVAIGAAFAWYF